MTERILAEQSTLGLSFSPAGGSFSVFSANATELSFCILGEDRQSVIAQLPLSRQGDIWSLESELLRPGIAYVLKAAGPKGPRHSFKQDLNLIDPYGKGVVRRSAREYYNVAVSGEFDWQGVEKPNVPLDEVVIYEAHVRGLTRGNLELPDELRGTYAALGHQSTISHLKSLGVTSIELLPIQMFISEPRLMNMGLINYWGYNTINFFSPHPRYASSAAWDEGPEAIIRELKTSIRELHRAGIEVILDVVYNHTAEGGGGGLTYSFRGLDNSSYYRQDDSGNYQDTTGCGNSLDFSNPFVVQLVLDSLRYWSEEMQIDGYRFDLATTLARDENNQYNPNHPLLKALEQDPTFANTKLIVEPWDVGLGGWQTGHFPDRFSEWNDRYRDDVRKFWLSDIGFARDAGHYPQGVASLATKLAGSVDVVDGPHGVLGGVNFITAHDGFTLRDLVSYNVKHNQVNGESNRDGANNNYSFNFGVEGDTDDESINSVRRRVARNLLGTLMFSSGIPMLTAGDERGKTQQGNNNAYCQDTQLSWLNWDLEPFQNDLEATSAFLIELRKTHPVLRPKQFANYESATEHSDRMRWFNPSGELMTEENWNDAQLRSFTRLTDHLNDNGTLDSMLLIVHGSEEELEISLPNLEDFKQYEILWDSTSERPEPSRMVAVGSKIQLTPLSIVLIKAS
ncbi:MAG: glycogen debranching protein GlgX [Actinomycetota bacterium]